MTKMKGFILCVLFSLFLTCYPVYGSGILKAPVGRSSMWRFFGAASFADQLVANRNDTELNCGGAYTKGDGDLASKCGLCGDPKGGPLYNEYGPDGIYVIQKPSAVYYSGSAINVTVTVANKKRGGFFQFYLCESDATTAVTEACFQQHRLPISGTTETQIQIQDFEGDGTFILDLPAGVTCQYCVLRWVWITAEKWGCNDDEPPLQICGPGYFNQPTYVNCADVKIVPQGTLIDYERPDYQSLYASLDASTIPPFTGTSPGGLDGTTTTTEPPPTTPGRLIGPDPIIPAVIAGTVLGGLAAANANPAAGGGGAAGNVNAPGAQQAGAAGLFGFQGLGILLPLLLLGLLGMGSFNRNNGREALILTPEVQRTNLARPSLASFGSPVVLPNQQTQISVSAQLSSGYPSRSKGYGQSSSYSSGYSGYSGYGG